LNHSRDFPSHIVQLETVATMSKLRNFRILVQTFYNHKIGRYISILVIIHALVSE